jgi:hypothetical protein
MTERKWALRKIAAGDWIGYSNDGSMVWRFTQYLDGPSFGLDWPRDRLVWIATRCPADILRREVEARLRSLDEIGDEFPGPGWAGWETVATSLDTRHEAVALMEAAEDR